jgi:DNA primase catalytic core
MARVSEAELEQLKKEVSLERLAQARGVELVRHGADLHGRCPFHEDKTPSLVVTPAKNLWHCLGACRTGGSVIDWVMRAEGVSFRHAVELLRADMLNTGNTARIATVRKLPSPVEVGTDDKALLGQVADYYHRTLKQSPEALAYLESRGLKHPEFLERFRLGFSDRTLGLRLPMKNREAGAAIRGRLQRLGILRDTGHEHFRGSIVFPILDEAGAVVGMYGRKVNSSLKPGTPLHLYLPGPHRGVWNGAALSGQKTVILCEAIIDALTFWCAGFRNVTAAYGVEGFTPAHLEAFKRHGVENVLIAYDRDDAGDAAAEKLSVRLISEGMTCWRLQFPKGMDANAYALKVQPAAKSLGVVLRQALWMGKDKPSSLPPTLEAAPNPLPSLAAAATATAEMEMPVERISTTVTPQKEHRPSKPGDTGAPTRRGVLPPEVMELLEKEGPEFLAAAREGIVRAVVANAGAAAPPEPPPPPPTTPAPSPKALEVTTEVKEEEVIFNLGDRRYRVRGLAKNSSFESLKVNLLVSKGEGFHVDTLDLYAARARAAYIRQAAEELRLSEEILKHDLGQVLLRLEAMQEELIRNAVEPKKKDVALSDAERDAALELLKSPNLLARVLDDFARCGVVGEETNKLVGYLGSVSRKLEEPLAILIQSSSAAGKSSLMEAVLAFVPEEDRVKYSAMTGQSLFYMGDTDLKHKVLAIVEEEGASRASYALKLLQSEGELTIASTGKDPQSGRLVTHEYRVEGPCQLFLTTTAIELDEELLNRCVVLTVDEDREQTRAIHRLQRERQTLEGLLARKDKDAILKLHRDAQRLLRPLLVANPFATALTFLDDRTRTRRDHMKYLTLIRTIALLHQYQRPHKTVIHQGQPLEYVEVTREDVAVANRLAHQVLGRSLDELPPQTRRLLMQLDAMVTTVCAEKAMQRKDCRFTRKDVRAATGWGDTQLKLHLHRLEELEYLVAHRPARGQTFQYELVYDGQGKDGMPFLAGLVDLAALDGHDYDSDRSGVNDAKSGAGRPQVGPWSVGGRSENGLRLQSKNAGAEAESIQTAHLEANGHDTSYMQAV